MYKILTTIFISLIASVAIATDFGVVTHFERDYEFYKIDKHIAKLKEIGFTDVRFDIGWGTVIKEDGSEDWSKVDTIIDKCIKANLKPLVIVGGHKTYTNHFFNNSQEWLKFVKALASRYKGKVSTYEIINEIDLGKYFPGVTREQAIAKYGPLFNKASKAIKEIDPNAKVIDSGRAFTDIKDTYNFIFKCNGNFDAFNAHCFYANYAPEGAIDYILNNIKTACSRFRGLGYYSSLSFPSVWITEMGWSSYPMCDSAIEIVKNSIHHLKLDLGLVYGLQEETPENMLVKCKAYCRGYKEIKIIKYEDLKNLKVPSTLLLSGSYTFQRKYIKYLKDYVDRGGTLIYACSQGIPFFMSDGYPADMQYGLNQLNIKTVYTGPDVGSPASVEGVKIEEKIKGPYSIKTRKLWFRNYKFKLLNESLGDKLTDVIVSKDQDKEFNPAFIVEYKSGGKFICVCDFEGLGFVNEEDQAAFLVRTVLYAKYKNIPKLFVFKLKDHPNINNVETSLGILRTSWRPKLSGTALKFLLAHIKDAKNFKLVSQLYDTSTNRTAAFFDFYVYHASWIDKDNNKIDCLYTTKDTLELQLNLKVKENTKILDIQGKDISHRLKDDFNKFKVSKDIIYIINAENVQILNKYNE